MLRRLHVWPGHLCSCVCHCVFYSFRGPSLKTVYIVRHAKSSQHAAELTDKERPLNGRGERDAPFMGNLLRSMGVNPDLVVTSPAVRARTTAQLLAEKLAFPQEKIRVNAELYAGDEEEILQLVRSTDNAVNQLMLVGHNPTLTILTNMLCTDGIENLPTCGVAALEMPVTAWRQVAEGCATKRFFEYPRLYFAK